MRAFAPRRCGARCLEPPRRERGGRDARRGCRPVSSWARAARGPGARRRERVAGLSGDAFSAGLGRRSGRLASGRGRPAGLPSSPSGRSRFDEGGLQPWRRCWIVCPGFLAIVRALAGHVDAPAGGTADPGRVDGRRGAAESAAGIEAPSFAGSSRQVRKRIEFPCASRPAATVRRRDIPRERAPSVRGPVTACAPSAAPRQSLRPGIRMPERRPDRGLPGSARQRRSALRLGAFQHAERDRDQCLSR